MAESVGRVRGKQGSAGGWREGASLSAGSEQVWVGRLLEGSVGENARMHPGGGAARSAEAAPAGQAVSPAPWPAEAPEGTLPFAPAVSLLPGRGGGKQRPGTAAAELAALAPARGAARSMHCT